MIEKTPDDDTEAAAPRTKEEVARALGAAPAHGRVGGAAEEALKEHGPLRLDKSGALAGRPKLEPVRALRKGGSEPVGKTAPPRRRTSSGGGARRASLPPKRAALRPATFEAPVEEPAPQGGAAVPRIAIPGGSFLYGESRRPRELPAFEIDKYPVSNEAYGAFVDATGHRPPAYWRDGAFPPEIADHPVVGVDYFDALAYARWVGKDLPFEDEWERAARGTDGRVYPWGNDQDLSGANTARVGLRMTVPVDLHAANVSPEGVRDMVGNAWEITHSPAPGGGVVVRGGSWYDFALYAKTYFRFASKPDASNGTIGFRCCVRAEERPDAPREVALEQVDAAIEERRGRSERVDPSEWSVERRDLILDLPRLRAHTAEVRAEDLIAPKRGVAVALHGPPERDEPLHEERVVVPAPPPVPAGEPESPAAPEPQPDAGPVVDEVSADPEPVSAEADERVHVGGAIEPPALRPPTPGTAPGDAATPDVEAEPEHEAPARPAAAARRGSIPPYLWILLTAGLLLFGGLVTTLVNQDDGGGASPPQPVTPSPAVTSSPLAERRVVTPTSDLPEPPPFEDFPGAGAPARLLDVAEPDTHTAIERGTWLLLFADTESQDGQQTLEAAHGLHRRLALEGVEVAVVLPRDPYADADGGLGDPDALAERLKADSRGWLHDGIPVLLDPIGVDGRMSLHKRYCREGDAITAVLLHEGRSEGRAAPPAGGFRLASLVRIGRSALGLARR